MNIEGQEYIFAENIVAKSSEGIYSVVIAFCSRDLRSIESTEWIRPRLHHQEYEYFLTLPFSKRQHSFLIGRLAAKQAVSTWLGNLEFHQICIDNGIFQQPVLSYPSTMLDISLTHSDHMAASIAYHRHFMMGIDMERVNARNEKALEPYFTEAEKKFLLQICASKRRSIFLGWTIKESMSKAIKTGFTVPIELFEIKRISAEDGYFKAEFTHFPAYQSLSFFVEDFVCSITYPRNITLLIDVDLLKRRITHLLDYNRSF